MSEQSSFYWIWPRSSTVLEDGSIVFKTSGWDRGEIHWTGDEKISPASDEFGWWKWVHENRRVLPPLVEKRIPADTVATAALQAPSDGIYCLGSGTFVAGWDNEFKLPVRKLFPKEVPTIELLATLSGANCFVFVNGQCEAALAINPEATETCVTPQQALSFIRSILDEPPLAGIGSVKD